jgi:hypothetical protein
MELVVPIRSATPGAGGANSRINPAEGRHGLLERSPNFTHSIKPTPRERHIRGDRP